MSRLEKGSGACDPLVKLGVAVACAACPRRNVLAPAMFVRGGGFSTIDPAACLTCLKLLELQYVQSTSKERNLCFFSFLFSLLYAFIFHSDVIFSYIFYLFCMYLFFFLRLFVCHFHLSLLLSRFFVLFLNLFYIRSRYSYYTKFFSPFSS